MLKYLSKRKIYHFISYLDKMNYIGIGIVSFIISLTLGIFTFSTAKFNHSLEMDFFNMLLLGLVFLSIIYPFIFFSRHKFIKKMELHPMKLLGLALYFSLIIPALEHLDIFHGQVAIKLISTTQTITLLALLIFLIYLFYQNFKMIILRKKKITEKDILLMLVVYVVTGIVFASIYFLVDLKTINHAFYGINVSDKVTLEEYIKYLYYSFVTLTSVGFGDIYPTTSVTRLLTVLESISGVFIISFSLGIVISSAGTVKSDSDSKKN